MLGIGVSSGQPLAGNSLWFQYHTQYHMLGCLDGYKIYITEVVWCHLPTHTFKWVKSWIKYLNIIRETELAFLFLDMVFVFHIVALLTMQHLLSQFLVHTTKIEMQCGVIVGRSVEILGKSHIVCLQFKKQFLRVYYQKNSLTFEDV